MERRLEKEGRMSTSPVTRGYGVLESFLAKKRVAMANRLIGSRTGNVLDIGCGSFPLFLSQSSFSQKTGIDQVVTPEQKDAWATRGVTLIAQDLDRAPSLPFPDAQFDVVTMLAVFEHMDGPQLRAAIKEIHRVLKPGGTYVLTTPAKWTSPILSALSFLRLVSPDEIDEHQEMHTHGSIKKILMDAGFCEGEITQGSFECGMNLWATASKSSLPLAENALRLSIVVPAYNEERTIAQIIDRLQKACPFAQMIFVDDGSRDGTLSIIKQKVRSQDVVLTKPNGGKGSAVRMGYEHATGAYIIVQDADLEYDPEEIPTLLAFAEEHHHAAVFGSRRLKKQKQYAHVLMFIGGNLL
jgi:SAM-dependent methyltransferase